MWACFFAVHHFYEGVGPCLTKISCRFAKLLFLVTLLRKLSWDRLLSFCRLNGGGANDEMANLTNEKGKFAIAIICHFSPFFAIFRHW